MDPYWQVGSGRLYLGDCLEVLDTLPEGSVHMACTSPPYFALREYGTGRWEGGDSDCDHLQKGTRIGDKTTLRRDGRTHVGPYEGERNLTVGYPYKDTCGKCGAKRVDKQLGLEDRPFCPGYEFGPHCGECYVCHMRQVFAKVKRVLRDDGVLALNLGSSYAGGELCDYVFYDSPGEVGASFSGDDSVPLVLRDDLSSDELAYVMSELSRLAKNGEIR